MQTDVGGYLQVKDEHRDCFTSSLWTCNTFSVSAKTIKVTGGV